ncbi:MAG: DUF4153 domain-containing protein [Clostridium sp.]|uniref:DUF4153 domain-containing protein n=1 Tax=Clostridium sp. TaxID=1506 RepID=UPI003D6CC8AC
MEEKHVLSNIEKCNMKLLNEERIKETKEIDSKISASEKILTICIAFGLAIIYDRLFSFKQVGISVVIFYVMFMGFFLWSIREKVRSIRNIDFIMIIPILLLAINYSIHSNSLLNYLNGVMILLLTVISTLLIRYRDRKWEYDQLVRKVFTRVFKKIPENIWKPFIFIKESITLKGKKQKNSTNKNILRGLIISIPLLIVIIVLLTSADMVFKNYLMNFSRAFENINIGNTMSHFLVIMAIFLISFSYIWSFKYTCKHKEYNKKTLQWEPISMLTVIFMINIVYLLFSIVQFSYLYGGDTSFLPSGFTYSEYARKGFFELFAVTIINFTILLSSMKFIKKDNKTISIIANILLTLLVGFTMNMLFSAHYKMSLYEQTYGFTYLRIFVHIFMFMLFLLFIIALIGIWNRKVPVNKVLLITVLIMYIVLNYINVDKVIAQKNIDIYYKTQKIDVLYLESLSYDATVEIIKLKNDSNEEVSSEVNIYLSDIKKELSKESSWYEFNYSKYRSKKAIN